MGNKQSIILILGYLCLVGGWIILLNGGYEYSGIPFGIAMGFFISNLISDNRRNGK